MVQVNGIKIKWDKEKGLVHISNVYLQAGICTKVHSFNADDFFKAIDMISEVK